MQNFSLFFLYGHLFVCFCLSDCFSCLFVCPFLFLSCGQFGLVYIHMHVMFEVLYLPREEQEKKGKPDTMNNIDQWNRSEENICNHAFFVCPRNLSLLLDIGLLYKMDKTSLTYSSVVKRSVSASWALSWKLL